MDTTVEALDPHVAYRAISGRDPRFDGRLFVGVRSTGIYCRPSCPARTPLPENCTFYTAAAAAVAAGFRACRRCRPDALPGTRDWDVRSDLAARALRGIADGVVDAIGVHGLAGQLHVSERHLHRVLVEHVGASPVQLARTRRAQLARMLLDQTTLPMADVAFAAGFASVRQFNDVMREQFGTAPGALRRGRPGGGSSPGKPSGTSATTQVAADGREAPPGATLTLLLRYTPPFDADGWWAHVAHRAVPGHEETTEDGGGRHVRRLVAGAGGPVEVEVTLPPQVTLPSQAALQPQVVPPAQAATSPRTTAPARGAAGRATAVAVRLVLADLSDLAATVARLRRWLDLDADPLAVDAALSTDPALAPLVLGRPGLRVAGTPDPFELAVKAVLGQQVSTTGARTLASRLVAAWGTPGPGELALFPTAEQLAGAGPDALRTVGLTGARAATLHHLAVAVADGLPLRPEADRAEVRAALLALPGIGPWTAEYVALRALGDPDVFPVGDLVLRRSLARLTGHDERTADQRWAAARSAGWSPWRGYAAQHLWTAASVQPATRQPALKNHVLSRPTEEPS